jgi:hypothetical protein
MERHREGDADTEACLQMRWVLDGHAGSAASGLRDDLVETE